MWSAPNSGWVVATQTFLEFSTLVGEDSHFDEHIFQMGWNQQPGGEMTQFD